MLQLLLVPIDTIEVLDIGHPLLLFLFLVDLAIRFSIVILIIVVEILALNLLIIVEFIIDIHLILQFLDVEEHAVVLV